MAATRGRPRRTLAAEREAAGAPDLETAAEIGVRGGQNWLLIITRWPSIFN